MQLIRRDGANFVKMNQTTAGVIDKAWDVFALLGPHDKDAADARDAIIAVRARLQNGELKLKAESDGGDDDNSANID